MILHSRVTFGYSNTYQKRRNIVTFTLLREPLALLMSQWEHDLRKEHITSVIAKYTVKDAMYRNGYPPNIQTQRLGQGDVRRAMERLHLLEFGLVQHFDASVCLLLYALQLRQLFFEQCRCAHSPLTDFAPRNTKGGSHDNETLSLGLLKQVWDELSDDQQLFAYAIQLFNERIRFVQKESGIQLIC